MGVEYRRYLIPRPNTVRPNAQAISALVTALQDAGWLLSPNTASFEEVSFSQSELYHAAREWGYFARTVGQRSSFAAPIPDLMTEFANRDLMLVWPVESLARTGLRYPLEPMPFDAPGDAEDCYYEIQLHFGRDFIYHLSGDIDPFEPEPGCSRGHSLECEADAEEDPFLRSANPCDLR